MSNCLFSHANAVCRMYTSIQTRNDHGNLCKDSLKDIHKQGFRFAPLGSGIV